jgi:hypothetical protein
VKKPEISGDKTHEVIYLISKPKVNSSPKELVLQINNLESI